MLTISPLKKEHMGIASRLGKSHPFVLISPPNNNLLTTSNYVSPDLDLFMARVIQLEERYGWTFCNRNWIKVTIVVLKSSPCLWSQPHWLKWLSGRRWSLGSPEASSAAGTNNCGTTNTHSHLGLFKHTSSSISLLWSMTVWIWYSLCKSLINSLDGDPDATLHRLWLMKQCSHESFVGLRSWLPCLQH